MAMQMKSKHCKRCGEQILAQRPGVNHILHLVMSVITGGLWLIIWLGSMIRIGGWRCSRCGKRV